MITNVSEILDSVSVDTVVAKYLVLKKQGVNYIAKCPFHDENSASFVVSPSKQIYKCFGCGEAGNSVGFLMKHLKLSYPQALHELAAIGSTKVIEEKQSPEKEAAAENIRLKKESLKIIYKAANQFYQQQLAKQKSKKVQFFIDRFESKDIIDEFEIGFATGEYKLLYEYLLKQQFKYELIIESGLVIERKDKIYDFFRNRIMFPIMDEFGCTIAFSGRDVTGSPDYKYLNSSDSLLYDKSKVLFGLFQAKEAIRKLDEVFLVEGNFDVTKLHLRKQINTVSANGTSLSPDQVKIIKRFTSNVTLMYDGDPGGKEAILKNSELLIRNQIIPVIVPLPEKEDPDSFF